MKYKRLVVMGDEKVFRYNGKFYSNDKNPYDYINCFEGIEEVVIWARIIDVPEDIAANYNELFLDYQGKKVTIDGIYNPPVGRIMGALYTIVEDYRKLSKLYRESALIFMGSGSPSQWLTWYLFRKRDLKFIGRKIGFPESTISAFRGRVIKKALTIYLSHFDRSFYKNCILQTWVSTGLEKRFAEKSVPSVVWHDTMVTNEDIVKNISIRTTETFELLFVGRLVVQKGIADIILALKYLNNKKIHLTIVGDGMDRELFENMVIENDLSDVILFKGQIQWGDKLWQEMQEAHCLILPSYNEGLGMVCVEAMANGVPVIGSNQGGIPDIVKNHINGLLIEPGNIASIADAIKTLYEDETLRRKLALNAIETAKENTRESQLKKFKDAYMKYVYPKL